MTSAAPNQTLRPLKERKSAAALARRDFRIGARQTVAQSLQSRMNRVVGVVNAQTSVLNRNIWGRLKWLMFGK